MGNFANDALSELNNIDINFDFLKLNKNIPLTNRYTVSVAIRGDKSLWGEEVSFVHAEIRQSILKEILKSIFSSQNSDFIDIRQCDFRQVADRIEDKIIGDEISFITNGAVGSQIQDMPRFMVQVDDRKFGSAMPNNIGSIGDSSIYVDPFMKWNDNRIACLLGHVEFNFGSFATRMMNEPTFAPRLVCEWSMNMIVPDCRVLYLIQEDFDTNYMMFRQHLRDLKIDDILDK